MILATGLKPEAVLVGLLGWIVPYLFLANYLERSLFPFRAYCYTQSDLLSEKHHLESLEHCVDRYHYPRKADPSCRLNVAPGTVIEPKIAGKPKRLAVVRSAPNAPDYRNFIRTTWKKDFVGIPVVFLVGLRDGTDLRAEAGEYQDILQFKFTDGYFVLGYKMTSTYEYFLRLLPDLEEIIVLNDDTIVNVEALEKVGKYHRFCIIRPDFGFM
ncbi:unnamed protein product, partial [Mesorhabditis spiculigera]